MWNIIAISLGMVFLILKVWNIRNVWICSIELFVFANMENKDYWNKIYVMLFSSYLTIKLKIC